MEAVACIAAEHPPWTDILSTARELVGADSGSLIMLSGSGDLMHVSHVGLAESTIDAYTQHFYKHDLMSRAAANQEAGAWLDSDEAIPRDTLLRSEFHIDYLHKNGQAQILALLMERSGQRTTAMSFQRSSIEAGARARLSAGETGTYVRAFQHALRTRQDAMHADIRVLDDTFAALGEAACVVSRGGAVLHLSALCASLLDNRQGLHVRHGQLRHANADVLAYVRDNIDTTLRTGQRTRAMVALTWGQTLSLDITLAPARWKIAGEALALIRIRHNRVDDGIDTAGLVSTFAITPAEARVLAGLVAGQSPADHAQAYGVSENTVRTQIARLKSKLNCSRTVDLVRLALVARHC